MSYSAPFAADRTSRSTQRSLSSCGRHHPRIETDFELAQVPPFLRRCVSLLAERAALFAQPLGHGLQGDPATRFVIPGMKQPRAGHFSRGAS